MAPKNILQNLPGCSSPAKSDNSVSEGVVDLSRFILRFIGCMAITSYLILIEHSQTRYYTVNNNSLPQKLPNTRNVFTASTLWRLVCSFQDIRHEDTCPDSWWAWYTSDQIGLE